MIKIFKEFLIIYGEKKSNKGSHQIIYIFCDLGIGLIYGNSMSLI